MAESLARPDQRFGPYTNHSNRRGKGLINETPASWRAVFTAIAIAITIAGLSGAWKVYDASKLDTARFVADSINRSALLLRIDSTTRRIEARLK
jgi:hypothetical protein